MHHLPMGTVTLLFTGMEGSTRLLQQVGERYTDLLEEHRQLLRAAFGQWNGNVVDTQGDAFFVAFARATDAVAAAVAAQRALASHVWPEGVVVRARMGLHTGEPTLSSQGYTGLDVHHAARMMSAGHGGQIDRHEQIVERVVPVAALAQEELLAPLGNHAHGWLDHAINLLPREGVAVQVQPWERLSGPICVNGPRNPLHQFLAVGVHPLCLAFSLLVVHHIHKTLFSCFSITHLEDTQNQTIICDNHSTTLRSRVSIIISR